MWPHPSYSGSQPVAERRDHFSLRNCGHKTVSWYIYFTHNTPDSKIERCISTSATLKYEANSFEKSDHDRWYQLTSGKSLIRLGIFLKGKTAPFNWVSFFPLYPSFQPIISTPEIRRVLLKACYPTGWFNPKL